MVAKIQFIWSYLDPKDQERALTVADLIGKLYSISNRALRL